MPSSSRPVLIASEIFRQSRHAPGHPLAIPRVSLAVDLCRALGWLDETRYREAQPAAVDAIACFHARDYIEAVRRAERDGDLPAEMRARFNLGVNGNPIYGEVFTRPATACGASLLGARLLLDGQRVVYSPAGGTHHGLSAQASGYCIFNDPVLAIRALLDGGLHRILYLDLDAHFGDGVQLAFDGDSRVMTISIHESGRWPMQRGSGGVDGPGGMRDRGRDGLARNLPVPAGFHDDELRLLIDEAVLPLLVEFSPAAVVVQCGADALADDPMTKLSLSNGALWRAVAAVSAAAERLLVLGGGGYNPWAVGRCWAGVWAAMNGFTIPETLPDAAGALLREVRWSHRLGRSPEVRWLTTLADPPRTGPIRPEIRQVAAMARVR